MKNNKNLLPIGIIIVLFIVFLLFFLFCEDVIMPYSDEFSMYTMSIFNLSLIILMFKQNKTLYWINLSAFVGYNAYLYYGLYNSFGGDGLVWLFFILLVNGFHFLGTLIYLVFKFW